MEKKDVFFKRVFLSKSAERIFAFLIGGSAYVSIELLYKGQSHITMFFAGAICFLLLHMLEEHLSEVGLLYRCIIYASIITGVEFVFGLVFNVFLGMNIWDYSERPYPRSGLPDVFCGMACDFFPRRLNLLPSETLFRADEASICIIISANTRPIVIVLTKN